MLPDLRFVLGATLAIAMLAMAGFGLAVSTQLLHEARVSSLEPTPSLAYAGRAEDNPFYDPARALRFSKAPGKPDEAQPPLATPPDPTPTPPAPPDEPAAVPLDHTEASTAGDKTADPVPARAVEPPPAPTPASSEAPKPTDTAEISAPPDRPKLPEAAAGTPGENVRREAEPEPVANAPAAMPGADIRKAEDAQPGVGSPAESAPPPAPAARPVHRRPRPRAARAPRPAEPGFQYSGFPTSNTQWPSYGSNQWSSPSPPAAKKKNGTLAGRQ